MLNISRQIYVGWDSSSMLVTPEAEIIPLGESISEKKKLEKFLIKHSSLSEYDNIPLPGFTINDVNKRHYSSTDSTWLVIDPRGFMSRITQSNMADILRVSGITEGLIQQRCLWARNNDSTELSLVPVSSAVYEEAVQNTNLIESRVDIDSVNIGDTVYLQNKMSGRYLGVMSLYASLCNMNSNVGMKVQCMLRKQVIEVAPGKFFYNTDLKILKVETRTKFPITREAAVEYVNIMIKNDAKTFFTAYGDPVNGKYYGSIGCIKLASTHAAPKVKINLVEIDLKDAVKLFNTALANSDQGCLIVENAHGTKHLINFPWWTSTIPNNASFYIIPIDSILDDRIVFSKDTISDSKNITNKPSFLLDNFTKFYKIAKSVKNDTYI
jgi:hypothetical protein